MKSIIVVAHGSRSKESNDLFFEIVDKLKERLEKPSIEGCFMEISKPSIDDKIEEMYEIGLRDFTILPYFMSPGVHIKRDIPEILKQAKKKYGDIEIEIAQPIGYHDKLIDILKERVQGEKMNIDDFDTLS